MVAPVIVFLVVVLSAWTAMHAYAVWRLARTAPFAGKVPPGALVVVAAALWASYPLARALRRSWLDAASPVFESVGAMWMGVLLLIVVWMLAADAAVLLAPPLRRRASVVRAFALGGAVLFSLIGVVQGARQPALTEYEVRLPDLPPELDGLVVVQLSDLHLGTLTSERWFARVAARVNQLQPDLLLVVGDVLDGDAARAAPFLPALRTLSARLGVFGVLGNHEFYTGRPASERFFAAAGVTLLSDRWVVPAPGLTLAGVDDLTARRQFGRPAPPPAELLAGAPAGATVLLSHTPWGAREAAAAGVGLMLSGHTHDGQIWPFGLLVRLAYPLVAGRYAVGDASVVVCRGTGTWGPRMRLWRRGEIVAITLRSAAPPGPSQRTSTAAPSTAFQGSARPPRFCARNSSTRP